MGFAACRATPYSFYADARGGILRISVMEPHECVEESVKTSMATVREDVVSKFDDEEDIDLLRTRVHTDGAVEDKIGATIVF